MRFKASEQGGAMGWFKLSAGRERGAVEPQPDDAVQDDDTPAETFVMFSVPESKLRGMDVATGPCVPVAGRKHALRSPHSQQGPERLEQMLALFIILGGTEDELPDAMQLVEARGPGRLYRCSDRFVQLMAEQNRHELLLIAEDEENGDNDYALSMAEFERLDAAWMATGGWHRSQVSTTNKLPRIAYARWAQDKGQSVFCWYGPPVPEYIIVRGEGPYPGKNH